MSFFTNLRADRLIAEIKASRATAAPTANDKALDKLAQARARRDPAHHRRAGERRQAGDRRLRRAC